MNFSGEKQSKDSSTARSEALPPAPAPPAPTPLSRLSARCPMYPPHPGCDGYLVCDRMPVITASCVLVLFCSVCGEDWTAVRAGDRRRCHCTGAQTLARGAGGGRREGVVYAVCCVLRIDELQGRQDQSLVGEVPSHDGVKQGGRLCAKNAREEAGRGGEGLGRSCGRN